VKVVQAVFGKIISKSIWNQNKSKS